MALAPRNAPSRSRPSPQARPAAAVRYVALCARHTEPLVAAELRSLPEVRDIVVGHGQVAFLGPKAALYRANLHLRCASRVLVQFADVPCGGPDELYAAARRLPWEDYLPADGTLAVSAHGVLPGLTNSMFTALKTKDAVCDRFRERSGRRPDVDPARPQVRINVQLYRADGPDGPPRCLLSLDSSDPPLHQRGYRHEAGPAPLKETLAASIVALTDELGVGAGASTAVHAVAPGSEATPAGAPLAPEKPRSDLPIVDLCCGSGTLLCEAGLSALRIAPGLSRRFGFQRWRDFDAALWQRLSDEARARVREPAGRFLFGSDLDRRAVQTARRNLAAAGLGDCAQVRVQDLFEASPPPVAAPAPTSGPRGLVICNPPYGERLGDENDLIPLYRALGDTLKRRFLGYVAYVYTANLMLARQLGLRPSTRHVLWNGPLEGRLLRFELY
jgi:putative N6-adenine-specific DNA methylase